MNIDRITVSPTQVCYLLGIDRKTLTRWYKYINSTPKEELPPDCPGLPKPIIINSKGHKRFLGTDMHKFYQFQKWIPRGRAGKMSKISRKEWNSPYYKENKQQNL